ncbi:MAG: uroporphyrinogen-III synthase [Alphaproteobacteria bacterium]|uniref:uroporphyrinogen-III synthase n=1 Tax=Hyphomonas sp. TaxID=87 RepID=UPI001D8AE754|nr:uroporphyrinogen-III synthase [Hyphomonas sp.]MBU4063594.1 uroporphyrinogen-III synthase [Alphaproteobacteria bacterium]MBU4165781.1 uroporphyrinogen-III synthase [Alphaproteobacteria bacterium]MBU4568596.1 uroporphyrinogen-III synthase [Alphaproteobacteria bacterium]
MTLPVIVTRSQPGARETAASLEALGFTPLLSPMLQIVETGFDPAVLNGVRHIVFTSVNGLGAVRSAGIPGDIVAWCVGPSTAGAAREAGFSHVVEGDGNAGDLARRILASGIQGPLLHIANEAAAGDLVALLRAGGCDARFCAPYRTEPAASLSAAALAALNGPSPVAVLLHSAKAAAAVAAGAPNLEHAALVAISAAALAPLKGQGGLGEWVARKPNDSDLMHALLDAQAAVLR